MGAEFASQPRFANEEDEVLVDIKRRVVDIKHDSSFLQPPLDSTSGAPSSPVILGSEMFSHSPTACLSDESKTHLDGTVPWIVKKSGMEFDTVYSQAMVEIYLPSNILSLEFTFWVYGF